MCAPQRRSICACQNEPRESSSSCVCAMLARFAITRQRPCTQNNLLRHLHSHSSCWTGTRHAAVATCKRDPCTQSTRTLTAMPTSPGASQSMRLVNCMEISNGISIHTAPSKTEIAMEGLIVTETWRQTENYVRLWHWLHRALFTHAA